VAANPLANSNVLSTLVLSSNLRQPSRTSSVDLRQVYVCAFVFHAEVIQCGDGVLVQRELESHVQDVSQHRAAEDHVPITPKALRHFLHRVDPGHLRTINPIESSFSAIRLRHRRTKGSGSRQASLTMMVKLAQSASRRWRRLNSDHQVVLVREGKVFTDGVLQNSA
jgi:hypothetical protein